MICPEFRLPFCGLHMFAAFGGNHNQEILVQITDCSKREKRLSKKAIVEGDIRFYCCVLFTPYFHHSFLFIESILLHLV